MADDIKKEAKNVNKMGDKMYKEKKYGDAIKLYVESVKLMQQAGDEKTAKKYQDELDQAVGKRAEEINSEGDQRFKEKKYEDAIKIYQNAYDLLLKAGESWQKKKGKDFLNELTKSKIAYAKEIKENAESSAKSQDWESATKIYSTILSLISPDVDAKMNKSFTHDLCTIYERWADEINKLGDQHYRAKEYEESIKKYTEALKLIEKSDNDKKKKEFQKELAKTFTDHAQEINKLGDQLMKSKEYSKASSLYAQSVKIAEESGNQKLINEFTKEMNKSYEKLSLEINEKGDRLFKEKKYEDAASIYLNSVEIAKESKKSSLVDNFQKEYEKTLENWAKEINSIGDIAMKEKKFDIAMENYKKSVEIISRSKNEKQISSYVKEYHKACLNLAKEINEEGDQLYNSKQFDKAYEIYDKSVQLAEIVGDESKIRNYSKERNKALEKMNE